MMKFTYILSFVLLFDFVYSLHLASYIKACKKNDPNLDQCGVESARVAIPELVKGDPERNVPKMNPMYIQSIRLAPISNLILKMRNITVKGLEKIVPVKFHFNLTTRDITFELFTTILDISGLYSLKGNMLIFPIEGNGLADIVYYNGTYIYTFHYNLIKKNNIEYMNITKHKITFTCEKAHFNFENLFNGNKLLANQILQFMNENWKEVNKDIGPYVAQAIDSIATFTANAVLNRTPYDEIFLP